MEAETSWEERMAERNRRISESAKLRDYGPMPTEPPECCAEWRLDGPHGWRQFVTCNLFGSSWRNEPRCDHEHHKDEVWLA